MKYLLLAPLLLGFIPFANANVEPKIAEFCLKATDFALIVLNYNPQISKKLMEPSGLEPLTPCMPCKSQKHCYNWYLQSL